VFFEKSAEKMVPDLFFIQAEAMYSPSSIFLNSSAAMENRFSSFNRFWE